MSLPLPRTGFIGRLAAPSWVRPQALNVTPDLLRMPLAPHGRRVLAILLDLAVVALLSSTGASWIAAGLVGVGFQWLRRTGAGRWRSAWLWIQDKVAHTVVMGLPEPRAMARVAAMPERAAADAPAGTAPREAT